MTTVGYIAATVPAKTDHASNTTLWHAALAEFGDPMQWVPIAETNGLVDPWIIAAQDILIPRVLPSGPPTGILGQ